MEKNTLSEKKTDARRVIALIINAAVIVMEVAATRQSVLMFGAGMLQFYTIDSNLIALASSLMYVVLCFKRDRPLWLTFVRYMAAVNLTLTFLVALTVLSGTSPGGVYGMMLAGNSLYHHTICPILTFISFIFLESDLKLKKSLKWLVVLPTLVYAVVMVILNLLGIVDGPYPFLHVYEQPVWQSVLWFAAILGAAFGIACGIYALAKKSRGKRPHV